MTDPADRPAPTAGAPDAPPADTPEDEVLFDAVITPHRSLSPHGFGVLMGAIGTISFVSGMIFVSIGAWPVFGFMGLDVLLIYWAFRLNYRSARAVEHVVLTREALTIRRFDHRGRRAEVAIQPYWLRIEVAGDEEAEQIRLTSHGQIHTVGDWLSPPERAAFAQALAEALRAVREPPPVAGTVGPGA